MASGLVWTAMVLLLATAMFLVAKVIVFQRGEVAALAQSCPSSGLNPTLQI